MPLPASETVPDRRVAVVGRVRRWARRLRWVMAGVLGLLLVYIGISFKVMTLPGQYDPAIKTPQTPIESLQPGDSVLLLTLNLWREPRLGDVVLYRNPKAGLDSPEQLIGRVAGMPGEKLARTGPTMSVGGREPLGVGFGFGQTGDVKDGAVIPDGHFLILADHDALAYADSRDVGFVPRDAVLQRVAMNLMPLLGRSAPAGNQ
ncbi:MAG: signal peptidase I [Planctomycetes bacterium]|nr:signal peptidase I [Planctomycetota bacterium]